MLSFNLTPSHALLNNSVKNDNRNRASVSFVICMNRAHKNFQHFILETDEAETYPIRKWNNITGNYNKLRKC